jgi:hypothetical protein
MATFRMLPPTSVSQQTRVVNGRSYSGAPGAAIDIVDCDAEVLSSNGWTKVSLSGPTSARPSPNQGVSPPYLASPGFHYFDTSLGEVVVYDGAAWRNPVNGNAV